MEEIHKLRAQISNIVQVNFPGTDTRFLPLLPLPDERQVNLPIFTTAIFDVEFSAQSS
jgi:ATP-dependent RNA helicase DHX37/DHR1